MPLPTSYTWTITSSTVAGSTAAATSGARVTGNGKTGIDVPVASDGRGRLALTSGNEQLSKLISLNLADLESANPFQQDLGLGPDVVFSVGDEKLRLEMRRRIRALFRRLQLADRARLAKEPTFSQDSEKQELTVDIDYINIEEDKPGTMALGFSALSTGGDPLAARLTR